jgi:hypothetical protein
MDRICDRGFAGSGFPRWLSVRSEAENSRNHLEMDLEDMRPRLPRPGAAVVGATTISIAAGTSLTRLDVKNKQSGRCAP